MPYVLNEDGTRIWIEDFSGFILQEGPQVWPVRLFPPFVIQYECANTITRLGDGHELRMNKNQAYVHANGQGASTSHRGRWGFSISFTAIEHANSNPAKEVNQLWGFIMSRRGNWEAFYFYNPMEAPVIDYSGNSATGRYLVRLVEPIVSLENFMLRLHRGNLKLIEVRA